MLCWFSYAQWILILGRVASIYAVIRIFIVRMWLWICVCAWSMKIDWAMIIVQMRATAFLLQIFLFSESPLEITKLHLWKNQTKAKWFNYIFHAAFIIPFYMLQRIICEPNKTENCIGFARWLSIWCVCVCECIICFCFCLFPARHAFKHAIKRQNFQHTTLKCLYRPTHRSTHGLVKIGIEFTGAIKSIHTPTHQSI